MALLFKSQRALEHPPPGEHVPPASASPSPPAPRASSLLPLKAHLPSEKPSLFLPPATACCCSSTPVSLARQPHLLPCSISLQLPTGLHRIMEFQGWKGIQRSASLVLYCYFVFFRCSVTGPLQPHGLQHTRLLRPPVSPRVRSNSCPLSR